MRLMTTCFLALCVTICSPILGADDDVAKAQKLIDRCIDAMGGTKALQKTKHNITKDKGTYFGMGDGIPYEGRYVFEFANPGRYRMEIIGFFVSVTDKDKAWMSAMGSVMDLEGVALKAAQEGALTGYVISLLPLQQPNDEFRLSLAGTETIEAEECQGIRVDHKDMPTCTIYFSNKSGLIKKTITTTKDSEQGFKEVKDETVYHEYKEFDGFLSPIKMIIYRDGKKYVESNPYEVSYPKTIDDKEFMKPE